jgi:hypothetical protein
MVTNKLPTSRTVIALCRKGDLQAPTSTNFVDLRLGNLALLLGRLAELPICLSLLTRLLKSNPAAYIDDSVALVRAKVCSPESGSKEALV